MSFYHAIHIDLEKCIGCAHCMKACPTEAIRIKDGKANLNGDRCVDCGECFRVCPTNAYSVNQDDLSQMQQYKYRLALVPSVFAGQFGDEIPASVVVELIKEAGFTHVYEIESCSPHLINYFNNQVKDDAVEKPVISSFCPAIVRLIQVSFPSLVDHIAPVKTPADIAAYYFKSELENQGVPSEDIGIFYITPCAAKIAAVKSPVGEAESIVNGAINLDTVYNIVFQKLKQRSTQSSWKTAQKTMDSKSVRWSLTNGEAKQIEGRSMSVDGMPNVIEFLEKVENEEVTDIDFLELRACDESCAGGILNVQNRFLIVEAMNKRGRRNREKIRKGIAAAKRFVGLDANDLSWLNLPAAIESRDIKLDEDMAKAMKKMERVRELMCFLPGIDCGACGAPTCKSLAEDIVTRKANLSHCVFMQRNMEKHSKLSSEHSIKIIEKVWGKDRLGKDCYKKGAKFESL